MMSKRNKFAAKLCLLSFVIMFAGSIESHAQQQDQTMTEPDGASISLNGTQSAPQPAFTGKYFKVVPRTESSGVSNTITISANSAALATTQTFSLLVPADADTQSLHVSLNGRDVSSRFSGGLDCSGTTCASGTLSAQDGMSAVKNVISATIKLRSGGMASGRWRSMSAGSRSKSPALRWSSMPKRICT